MCNRGIQSLGPIKEAVRNCRQKEQTIDNSITVEILAQLENNGEDICSRIEPSIFCRIIETAMLAQPSKECQRVVHLLGVSSVSFSLDSADHCQGFPASGFRFVGGNRKSLAIEKGRHWKGVYRIPS